ncbi:hypothetical protein RGU70_08045 [Herbaspirillum sp. RTI4]|uniref:hypothetical protein n=1 Tax=Herbaspirillum sp. RTI4 TaxID=3048640 RepID=UPI002AB550A5|nr:hypothetical protein [Herbaspirillum sp. RTI4]MDY7578270.1 hypothetical protein [Herbaspirillum sp. RTI4]MEA9981237.1 hypothetical protein [Herbaspirillum sp. RTI4]
MKKILAILALSAAAAGFTANASAAQVSVGVYAGAPAQYYSPSPVVYAPPLAYYRQAPVYAGPGWRERRDRREWRERQWRRDRDRRNHRRHGRGRH